MTFSVDSNFVNQFSANIHLLVDQRGSKLKGLFREEFVKGEKAFFDRIGLFSANEIVSNLAPVNLQDAAHSRRMATLKVYEAATYVQGMDKLKMIIDPTSDYAKILANAHGKNFDAAIIAALIGTAATGKDGSGSAAFDTSNNQIAHGSVGLTADKLLNGLRILQSNEVDMDVTNCYLLVNARGMEDLLADSKFNNGDYQEIKALSGRSVPSFRGLKIIQTERLPAHTAGSVYRGIICTEDSLRVAMAQDMKVDISKRADIQNLPMQIYTEMAFGAVRMQEELVVDILFQ